jgi:hypothetical protein
MASHRTGHSAVRLFVFAAAVLALVSGTSHAAFITFESVGATAASITPTRDAFRTQVGGGTVAGANGSFGGLRREINWDGVPEAFADPNALPANFFNVNSPRGAVFSTPGTGFLVSANAGGATPTLFGFPNDLQAFSAQKLFTAVNSNITDVNFFIPGTSTPATTSAFAAIFVDVEVANSTKIEFFDQNNALIFSRFAPVAGNQGLTFLGAAANAGERISRVRITSGANTLVSNGVLGDPNNDLVVMDDFLYAEPTAVPDVPEPATLTLALVGLTGIVGAARRRRSR